MTVKGFMKCGESAEVSVSDPKEMAEILTSLIIGPSPRVLRAMMATLT